VGDGAFDVQRPRPSRNSWRPQLRGRLVPHAGGTAVTVDLAVHPFVLVFTAFHAVFFLGLSWILGAVAFSREVEGAEEALAQALGATVRGEREVDALFEPADPSRPGAESGAPPSLRARVEPDRVAFRVDHATLRADAVGVEVPGEVRVAWTEIGECRVGEGQIVLEDAGGRRLASFSCADLPPRDADWLAAWIGAQAGRRRTSPEEAERQDRERQRLARLVRDVDR
jgi:hypothetical protein